MTKATIAFGMLAISLLACSQGGGRTSVTEPGATNRPPIINPRDKDTFSELSPAEIAQKEAREAAGGTVGGGGGPGGPAPEPGTMLLLGSGLLGVALVRRRRTAARSEGRSPLAQ